MNLKGQCHELLAAKQDLIDKGQTVLVENRNLVQRMESSVGIPFTSEDDDAFTNFKQDYGCSIDIVKSPFLVQEWKVSRNDEVPQRETLRLDMIQASKSQYYDADIIIFNTGYWWNHEKTKNGRNYFQQGNHVYDRLEVSEALQQAFKTWAKWADSTVDSKHTYKGLFHWIFSFSLQARRM